MSLLQICKIKNQLTACCDYMNTLNSKVCDSKGVLLWFKLLCDHLINLIICISENNKELKENLKKGNRDTLLLYLSQLITSLSLLINIFVRETDVQQTLIEARYCAKRQIIWCLNGIQETIMTNKSILDPSGSFIKWMDSALDKIAEISDKEKTVIIGSCMDARVLFEEVLSHAMSIAQVVLKEDCTIIRGSSQTVLESLDCLTKEINKSDPNPAMVNLFADTCTDKLCALERRVNTAVLKLSLKVFSEYTVTLEAICNFCLNEKSWGKGSEELDSLVADFDLHVDRIMQIGLFAVSCSTCSSRGIKIRSCLASLEALECELVPAFTAMVLDHSTYSINLALLLRNHWLRQAHILRQLIYLIIDPFAFCQVIYEENKQIVDGISDNVKTKGLLDKKSILTLTDQAKVLQDFIDVVLKEEKKEAEDKRNIKERFDDFKSVLHEVKCASNILLENNRPENNLRMLKRCKILLTTIKKLWYCFIEEDVENVLDRENSVDSNEPEKFTIGNVFLDHIINRGKQILKDRSVLYKSSLRSDTFNIPVTAFKRIQLKEQHKPMPLSKLVHLRKLSFMNTVGKNESLTELQLSDILNELNNMTNTLGGKP